MNGNIPPALFRDLDQPEAYEILTEIFRYGPSRANELIDAAPRSGGITDNGVRVVQPYGSALWTITKES